MCVQRRCAGADDACALYADAVRLRKQAATGVNSESSRSHAVFTVSAGRPAAAGLEDRPWPGLTAALLPRPAPGQEDDGSTERASPRCVQCGVLPKGSDSVLPHVYMCVCVRTQVAITETLPADLGQCATVGCHTNHAWVWMRLYPCRPIRVMCCWRPAHAMGTNQRPLPLLQARSATLSIVDLAGTERAARTGNCGKALK